MHLSVRIWSDGSDIESNADRKMSTLGQNAMRGFCGAPKPDWVTIISP